MSRARNLIAGGVAAVGTSTATVAVIESNPNTEIVWDVGYQLGAVGYHERGEPCTHPPGFLHDADCATCGMAEGERCVCPPPGEAPSNEIWCGCAEPPVEVEE